MLATNTDTHQSSGESARNFFVVGLPRSRTAWLANFLTHGPSFCYHEGLNGCRSVDAYKQKLGTSKGDSSTGLMLIDLHIHFPDAKTLIIESDPQKSIEYVYRTYGVFNPGLVNMLKSKMDALHGWRIHVDEINNKLPEIWNYLIGAGYDADRAELLKKFNVQVQDPFDVDAEAARILLHA